VASFRFGLLQRAGNTSFNPEPYLSFFRPILEKAKLPQIRLYDRRHTCATLLLIAEENPKVVSERLGHSTIVLTLDTYSHVLPTMPQGVTARLEKLLYDKGSAQISGTTIIQTKTGR
jgi:integrase